MKKHVAGIVPVAGLKSDIDLPWHASLMPIGPDYLAIERAVVECAYAGCNTIWIVCNDDVTPLIRHRLGEKIQDPVYTHRHFQYNKNDVKRPIRIYYVPLSVRDINKRDNLAWSAMYGAKTAHSIIKKISKWLTPDKFYVSWPYGHYNPAAPRPHRRTILEGDFALSYDNCSARDGLYLGMTLTLAQIDLLFSQVREKSSGLWVDPEDRTQMLSKEERFSYRNLSLAEVFESLEMASYTYDHVEEYDSLDCWSDYCSFLATRPSTSRPKLLKYSEWNEIGIDEED